MKNYTSLDKMKASEVAPSFTEEKVTAETFPQEVAKGTLYKGFEPPKDATMLKFRYYSPDGTLIEQNNVPVVYDGTGIESVVTYYLLTDKKDGITLESDGWTDIVQTVTAEKRFLWTYTKTTYTNKAFACTDPCITAVFGEQGERGAMYLGHYKNAQAAFDANKPAVFTGDYYLDTTDSFLYVYNKENNVWAKIDDLTDYRYNQSINDIFEAINDTTKKEEFLKAKIAWVLNLSAAIARVQMLLANEIQLTSGKDLNGNNSGGIIRSSNYNGTIENYRIKTNDKGEIVSKSTKGWTIDNNGTAEFNNVTVRGTVDGSVVKGSTISGGSITIGSNFSVDKDGNTTIGGTSVLRGDIYSDSMESNSLNPTSKENSKSYAKETSTKPFVEYAGFAYYSDTIPQKEIKYYAKGTYGSLQFEYFILRSIQDASRSAVPTYGPALFLYDASGNCINSDKTYGIGLRKELKNGSDSFQENFSFDIYDSTAKTFVLKNLPICPPTTKNALWIDSNGFLRINRS